MLDTGLVYIGKIISMEDIPGTDFISSATVVCGNGGKWKGVVRRSDFKENDLCIIYLPDSIIPPNDDMKFMESTQWRVKMRRFKDAPSEVVITKDELYYSGGFCVGRDITFEKGVTKYRKPIPANLQGKVKGEFPGYIPKTDEPNYQIVPELIEELIGKPYYITEKADGSSTTAYKYKGKFGVCSRNWELERDEENGYWKIAIKYNLEEKLPEGYAIQWETCGPNIHGNPMGWKEITGLMFSAYDINEKRYLDFIELYDLSIKLDFPMVRIYLSDADFDFENVELLAEGSYINGEKGTYSNGKQREGVVVRSQKNLLGHKPISFKVINLNYEK